MTLNIAVGRISKKTMSDLDEYMRAFCPGELSAFWVGDQVFLELASVDALALIRAQFPEIDMRVLHEGGAPPPAPSSI
ncbi:hypothetical protein E4L95_03780 [Paracoccus liaowanqingii]|uniref:Uncharacterized protein n=1 Tax=Paracoccus liaowanqingii TaxID=2560053 RepID=A0A4Z1CRC8_9RHOB|nr:hypothetical protein [Paracoccus liaowanqingii]TGN67740.1 hypothetical protein E4L95_03780 [Paracoccus liaowanqingii]